MKLLHEMVRLPDAVYPEKQIGVQEEPLRMGFRQGEKLVEMVFEGRMQCPVEQGALNSYGSPGQEGIVIGSKQFGCISLDAVKLQNPFGNVPFSRFPDKLRVESF